MCDSVAVTSVESLKFVSFVLSSKCISKNMPCTFWEKEAEAINMFARDEVAFRIVCVNSCLACVNTE